MVTTSSIPSILGNSSKNSSPPHTGDRIGSSDELCQSVANGTQEPVSNIVSQRVVDFFESIQVEEDHGQLFVDALGLSHRDAEAVCEQHPVGQAGQKVMRRPVSEFLLRPLT